MKTNVQSFLPIHVACAPRNKHLGGAWGIWCNLSNLQSLDLSFPCGPNIIWQSVALWQLLWTWQSYCVWSVFASTYITDENLSSEAIFNKSNLYNRIIKTPWLRRAFPWWSSRRSCWRALVFERFFDEALKDLRPALIYVDNNDC